MIGDRKKSRDSSGSSEKRADIDDILEALQKLDKCGKTPRIIIDALCLGKIPNFTLRS